MVRRAVKKDIEAINKLGALLDNNFANLFNMKKVLKDKYAKVYVYEKDSQVIGFIHITALYETVDIINVVVDEKHRREGIASIMIDYMISGVSTKVEIITLEVAVDNKKAISLYEKFGFEIINTRKAYYYSNKDAYLMGKRMKT